jgi:hypothetical protein
VTPQDLLNGPGCVWWSADTLDKKGNGLCLSWGFGHPEARRGDVSAPAKDIGSLEVLVFSQGAPTLWLHQRFVGEDTWWRGTICRFGSSQIEMLQDLRARIVIARLDCHLPRGEKLEGTIEVAATPTDGNAPLWGETTLLAGPGKGQGAVTAHGRPFTVLGEGSIVRRTLDDLSAPRADMVTLQRDHTVVLSSQLTDDGWQTQAASIDRQGHVSDTRTLHLDDAHLGRLIDGELTADALAVDHEEGSAFELREVRAIHPEGRRYGLWHANAYAPMELARPSLVRTWPGAAAADHSFVLDADASGSRRARRLAGAQSRKPGLLERLMG